MGDDTKISYVLHVIIKVLSIYLSALMMAENSDAIKEAPPTNPPSTSGCENISFALAALTLPPYKIDI
jgi:hypothetical protein